MLNWKNVQYANGSGLVNAIRGNNAQINENNKQVVDSISQFGDDYSKTQTDAAIARLAGSTDPQQAQDILRSYAQGGNGFVDQGLLADSYRDQTQEFRDNATHADTLQTNAQARKTSQQAFDIADEQRKIKLVQLNLDADATIQEKAAAQQLYDFNTIANIENINKLRGEVDAAKLNNDNLRFKNAAQVTELNNELSVSESMAWLQDDNLFLKDPQQIRDARQEFLASNVPTEMYSKQLAEMSIKSLVNGTNVIPNLDKASETDIVKAINKIKGKVITQFPGLSLDDAAKATSEMLIQAGVENRKGVLDAAKVIEQFKTKEDIKQKNTLEINKQNNLSKEKVEWIKNNSSGASSKGKTKMLDRLSGMEFATDDFLLLGDSPGTALMGKLSPMIETLYPDAKDQNKIWNYLATSGFPTADSSGRNSFLVGGVDSSSDAFNDEYFKAFIDKTGILNVKTPTPQK